jgi:hypothetical protein
VEVFKEAERKAMEMQKDTRGEAQQRKRVARTGQTELFSGIWHHHSKHYNSLRTRYLTKAKSSVQQTLKSKQRLLYEEAWALALSEPLCWESDLKQWIEEWKQKGHLEIEGMGVRQRVPHRNEGNYLIWR